jgi:hypothetical protein
MLSINDTDKLTYFPWKSGVLEHDTLGKRAQCGDWRLDCRPPKAELCRLSPYLKVNLSVPETPLRLLKSSRSVS